MTLIEMMAQRSTAGLSNGAIESSRRDMAIHLLDTVSAWIAGRTTREGQQLYQLRRGGQVSLAHFDTSLLDSIALSTATARLTEVDDMHMASCTAPGAVVIPTALAIAAQFPSKPPSAARIAASCRATK